MILNACHSCRGLNLIGPEMRRHLELESMMRTDVLVLLGSLEYAIDAPERPLGLPLLAFL